MEFNMATTATSRLEELRQSLPEPAKDLKLNLQSVLQPGALTAAQALGCALTSAYFLRHEALAAAVLEEAKAAGVDEKVIDDAKAAAAIMAMNTVYYRTRHLLGKDSYTQKPARLRMNRMMQPASGKVDFELFSMSAAALAGCEICIQTHEASLLKHGASEDAVLDSVRIAAVISGVAAGLGL